MMWAYKCGDGESRLGWMWSIWNVLTTVCMSSVIDVECAYVEFGWGVCVSGSGGEGKGVDAWEE